MCRWLAYSVLLEELLYKPAHSLIDQSLHAELGATTTNGDGFGIGWYGNGDEPAVYRSVTRLGTTATCGTSPPTSRHRSSSPTSERRRGRPSRRRTPIPSATDAGSSCTTGSYASFRA